MQRFRNLPLQSFSLRIHFDITGRSNHHSFIESLPFNFQTNVDDPAQLFAASVAQAALRSNAKSIIVSTSTSSTETASRNVAMFRPKCPVIAVVANRASAKQLHLHRGVFPVVVDGEEHWLVLIVFILEVFIQDIFVLDVFV